MKTSSKLIRLSLVAGWLVVMAIAFGPQAAYAATCTSNGNGNWSSISWTGCGSTPGSSDDVVIDSTVTLDGSKQVRGLKINSGKIFNGSSNTLTVGYFENNGGTFNRDTGTVSFVATTGVTPGVYGSSSTIDFNNVTISTGVDFGNGKGVINNTLTINNGGSVPSSKAPTYASGSTLKYNTGNSYTAFEEWYPNTTSGPGVPHHVEIGNGTTLSFGSTNTARTMKGNLTIGGTLQLSTVVGGDLNIAGNWTNNGTFTHNNRTVTFNGGGTSTYGGSSTTTFNNLTVNAGTTLDVGTNTLFNADGTVTNNGTLKQTRNVNNATVAFLNIKNSAGTTDKYFGVQIATTNNLGSTVVSVSGNQVCSQANGYPVKRCFNVTPATQASADIKFYYQQTEMQGQAYNTLNVWNYHSSAWNAVTRGGDSGSCGINAINCYVQGNSISTYSPFALKVTSPQAVTLADFSAAQTGDAVLLTWETNSELNNRGFNLYRGVDPSGRTGSSTTTLIPSQSQGNPGGFIYTWEDRADLVPGTTYYYWVEDVDLNNVATRHGPVSVDYSVPTAVRVLDAGAAASLPLALPLVGAGLLALAGLAARRRRR